MAGQKKLIGSLLSSLQSNIGKDGLNNRQEITAYTMSSESLDQISKDSAVASRDLLEATIDRTIGLLIGTEEFKGVKFSVAQLTAAKSIAALAIDPQTGLNSLKALKDPSVSGDSISVSAEQFVGDTIIDASTLSVETFDGQAASNALYLSIATTLLSTTQDTFGEAFWPTMVIDPMVSGIAIETEFTSLFTTFERSRSGTQDKKKFNKQSLVKVIYDNDLFTADRNKVVVVKAPENENSLMAGYTYIDKTAGVEIETAPLLFGKNVSLLGLSQTDALLAKGVMDETDTLDRTINLDRVFYTLSHVDNGNTVNEIFSFDASLFPYSNFTSSVQQHAKDFTLSFETESVIINTSATKTVLGEVSGALDGLADNHSIRLEFKLSGKANAAYGDVEVFGNAINLVEVIDAAGNKLATTSATYIAIKAVIDTIKFGGYTLEAYRTNSNLRTAGDMITSDRYSQVYAVPLRTGVTVTTPINNVLGTDNDSKLTSQIQMIGMRVSKHAVQELVKTAEVLKSVTISGVSNVELMGIGRFFVDTFYQESSIDLANYVDSISSNQRAEDIKAALVNKVKDEVLKMYLLSNYGIAFEALNQGLGKKITVVIGTNPRLRQYLTAGDGIINIGDDFEVKVVSTPNKLISDKMYITFCIFDEDRNVKPNPLNFGQCVWAPTITYDVNRTVNNSTVRAIHTMPRYAHILNLPIMSVINVSDIEGVLGKVKVYTHEA